MKACASCGAENPDGARFCIACGTSLIPACPDCGAELPEGARFCPSCGAAMTEPEPAPAGQERRLVTILFADVTGSTGLGERLDPEHLQEVLGSYFAAMREAIEAEGGTVEKFIGDAVMAAFGVPVAHEDDPARALRAALRMRTRLGEVNDELERDHGVRLQMRIGVNTGGVLASVAPKPGEPMVTGDAVNVAARLEQAAEPGQILVAERTARAARRFRFSELEPLALKGKERPVPAVVLLAEGSERPERGVPGMRPPMVGRDREIALLRDLYERAVIERRPDLVTIYGEPGVGKSRLATEFASWASTQQPPPTIVGGRCLPYGAGITYWPLAEILKTHAGILDTDSPQQVLAKVRVACDTVLAADRAIRPERACSALAYTMGVEDPEAPMHREPRQVRLEMHAAWRGFFTTLAAEAPVVVVIEDIHWADPALLDLLEEVAERSEGPLLFICPARPELADRRPSWGGGRRNASSIALDPLSPEESNRLVSLLLSVEDLPETTHRRILERAEGNPFFLEEIVRKLIDEGQIVREGDRWRAADGMADVEIPDTVQGVLAARIDLLLLEEKRTLQLAAVVGRVFWPAPVGLLLNGERDRLEETLERLEDRDLVRSRMSTSVSGEPEFVFKHVLTRDVAYESLPRRDRSRAHAAVAEWMASSAGERWQEFAELLAYHYEEAYRGAREEAHGEARVDYLRARAFDALLEASETARTRFALENASRLAERALAVAATPLERARTLEQIGVVALNDYRGDLAWASFKEAVDLRMARASEDRPAIARLCARAVELPMRWPGSMSAVPPEEQVAGYLRLGMECVGEAENEERVRLLTAQAFGPFAFSAARGTTAEDVAAAGAAGEEAAGIALRLGRIDLASAALDGAASAQVAVGNYGRCVSITERRLALLEAIDDPWERGDIHAMAAWGWWAVGDYPAARRYAEAAWGLLDTGAEGTAIHCLAWAGLAEFHMGNWDVVVGELMPAVESLLGDRREAPPYFTQGIYGASALIAEARGEARGEHLLNVLRHLDEVHHEHQGGAGVKAWIAWILTLRRRLGEARDHLEAMEASGSRVHRPLGDQVWAIHLAEAGGWDEVPAFVDGSRAYAGEAGLWALPVHLDRLEGRAALAAGDIDRAVRVLGAASEGFARLRARWERACTDLSLAEALLAAARPDEARLRAEAAAAVFEEVRSQLEIERTRNLLERLS